MLMFTVIAADQSGNTNQQDVSYANLDEVPPTFSSGSSADSISEIWRSADDLYRSVHQ